MCNTQRKQGVQGPGYPGYCGSWSPDTETARTEHHSSYRSNGISGTRELGVVFDCVRCCRWWSLCGTCWRSCRYGELFRKRWLDGSSDMAMDAGQVSWVALVSFWRGWLVSVGHGICGGARGGEVWRALLVTCLEGAGALSVVPDGAWIVSDTRGGAVLPPGSDRSD